MKEREVALYIDYKSPYAYIAKDRAYELENEFDLRLRWLPYTLDVPAYLGAVEDRNPHQWRRVRYSYMDCRRLAANRGLVIRGPKKIYDSTPANIGLLYATRHGRLRPYNDMVFERFFKRELEIDDPEAIRNVLNAAGAQGEGFLEFAAGEGRREHDRIRKEAEQIGIFGVPSFVLGGEIFWGGDRIGLLCERLGEFGWAKRR